MEDGDHEYRHDHGFVGIESSWREVPSPKGCECEFCIDFAPRKKRQPPMFNSIHANDAKSHGDSQLHFLSDYILRGYALKEQKWCEYRQWNCAFECHYLLPGPSVLPY